MNRKEQNIAIFEDSMDWIEHKPAGSHSRAEHSPARMARATGKTTQSAIFYSSFPSSSGTNSRMSPG